MLRTGFSLDGAAYGGRGPARLGGGVVSDVLVGHFGAVAPEHLGGFEAVVRLEVGELTFHGVDEEPADGLSAVGLFADEGSEGLQAGVLYVYVWAVWHC